MALRKISELRDVPVVGPEGPFGLLRDVYFDREGWPVRYLVVETGPWLRRRRVLIAPSAVSPERINGGAIALRSSRDELCARAAIAHLDVHSARAICGYRAEAAEGAVGRVCDLVLDDALWTITGMVVDMHEYLSGQPVLVSAAAVATVRFGQRTIRLRLGRQDLKSLPRAACAASQELP